MAAAAIPGEDPFEAETAEDPVVSVGMAVQAGESAGLGAASEGGRAVVAEEENEEAAAAAAARAEEEAAAAAAAAARARDRQRLNAQRALLAQKRQLERELVDAIREARLAYEPLADEDDKWHEIGELRRDQASLRESIGRLRGVGGVGDLRAAGEGGPHFSPLSFPGAVRRRRREAAGVMVRGEGARGGGGGGGEERRE